MEPKHEISCSGIASCVEYGPSMPGNTSTLLAIGSSENTLGIQRTVIDDDKSGKVQSIAQAIHHETLLDMTLNTTSNRIRSLSWSPQSMLSPSDHDFRLATLSGSSNVVVVKSNDFETVQTEVNIGHTGYVNDVTFVSLDERFLATPGDDSVVHVTDIEEGVVSSAYQLLNPGMSIRVNPSEPQQMLVCEKGGILRFYHRSLKRPIRSIECKNHLPLMQADWSIVNSTKVGVVAGNHWICWDVRYSSLPMGEGVAHNTPAVSFRWCRIVDDLFSTYSSTGQFKIHHFGHKKNPVSYEAGVVNGVSWHSALPVVALGRSRRISFWDVEI